MVTVINTEAPVLGHAGDFSAWDMTISVSFDRTGLTAAALMQRPVRWAATPTL